jgi:hypothetical protein
MKTYRGSKKEDATWTVSVERWDTGETIPLPLRLDLCEHSPAGFAWGHGGSAPAQLALALLADHLDDDERALTLHQPFKWHVVSALRDEWTLTSNQIESAIADIEECP